MVTGAIPGLVGEVGFMDRELPNNRPIGKRFARNSLGRPLLSFDDTKPAPCTIMLRVITSTYSKHIWQGSSSAKGSIQMVTQTGPDQVS